MDFVQIEQLIADLPADARAAARSSAVHAIQSGEKPDLSMIPEWMKADFFRLVNEAAYRRRSKDQPFNPDIDYMPTQGTKRDSNPILINVRL